LGAGILEEVLEVELFDVCRRTRWTTRPRRQTPNTDRVDRVRRSVRCPQKVRYVICAVEPYRVGRIGPGHARELDRDALTWSQFEHPRPEIHSGDKQGAEAVAGHR
jgi:hypothetical protein